jgi:hypothetical protein
MPVLFLYFWHACSLSLFLARLFSFSISGTPVLFLYFWHACSLSLFLARLFSFPLSGTPVLFLYFWLACSLFLFLAPQRTGVPEIEKENRRARNREREQACQK